MDWMCLDYVANVLASAQEIQGPVLELGSLDVNGSARGLFWNRERFPSYIGLDMRPGRGVDIIAKSWDLPIKSPQSRVVVCTEMLEHDLFWRTFEAIRGCRFFIFTTRGIGYKRHDHPKDYFRFTAEGLMAALSCFGFKVRECVEDEVGLGVYGWAVGGLSV